MRHGRKINHLGRTAEHRKAMMKNMATSLILHKRIFTTLAKAKELRKFVEPLLTKSKDASTHSQRIVFGYLRSKDAVKILFGEIAGKIAERNGGYTRILKTGNRAGDNAEMCMIELVDYNLNMLGEATPSAAKSKRTRRSKKAKSQDAAVSDVESTDTTPSTEN